MNCKICGEEIEEEFNIQTGFDNLLFEPMGYGTTLRLITEKNSFCEKCRNFKRG